MKLQGILVDAATPFDHTGALYRAKVTFNVEKWCRTSVAGFLLAGPAGEAPLLASEEIAGLWRLAAEPAKEANRILLAGIDRPGVTEAVALCETAASLDFAAAVVELPRFDAALHQRDTMLRLYFKSLADRSPIPILIACRPAQSGFAISQPLIEALAQHPNIGGLVWEGASARIAALRALRADWQILGASAESALPAFQAGAHGALLALASAIPYAAIAIWEAFRTREEEAALDWQSRILPAADLVSTRFRIPALKRAMDRNGFYGGIARLPWPPLHPPECQLVDEAFQDLRG